MSAWPTSLSWCRLIWWWPWRRCRDANAAAAAAQQPSRLCVWYNTSFSRADWRTIGRGRVRNVGGCVRPGAGAGQLLLLRTGLLWWTPAVHRQCTPVCQTSCSRHHSRIPVIERRHRHRPPAPHHQHRLLLLVRQPQCTRLVQVDRRATECKPTTEVFCSAKCSELYQKPSG